MHKKIAADAYQALRDALPVIVWNKKPFESYLRTALRDSPELLAGLNFNEPKRIVADLLVDRLVVQEHKYQPVTLALMLELSSMSHFPNVQQIKDEKDRAVRLREAQDAVAHLAMLTKRYSGLQEEQQKQAAARDAHRSASETLRRFSDDIELMRREYMALHKETDKHKRGYSLERFLNQLFTMFDMEPRLAYSLDLEQIDGSVAFDTDDYVIEARWRTALASRGDADIFATKVRRKGKNALGLFVSISGFASTTIEQYDESTPFLAIDGGDIACVLEQRIRLDDLIRQKRRHSNETGSCYVSAFSLLA